MNSFFFPKVSKACLYNMRFALCLLKTLSGSQGSTWSCVFPPLSSTVDRLKAVSLHPHFLGAAIVLSSLYFFLYSLLNKQKFQNCESVRELNFIADIYLRVIPFAYVAIPGGDSLRLNNHCLLSNIFQIQITENSR